MPLLLVASLVVQFLCLVHVFRTGRPYWWAWIILIGSFLGAAVYFVTQILPDLRYDPRARRAARKVQHVLDPDRDRRTLSHRLEAAPTVANRLALARERLAANDVLAAEPLLQQCLQGMHATDPDIMLELARCQFLRGDMQATRRTLDALIAANPDFRSPDGHLLYARALEAGGDAEAALHEYQALAEGFPGEEGRVRYGLLLKRVGRANEAEAVFRDVLRRARLAPGFYWQSNREWIETARRELRLPA